MAGDWIKFEVATATKPEIAIAAEFLGVSRREALGIFLDFWCWLDANACADVVPHVSRKSLETSLHCVGFAAILEMIGWAKFDDAARKLTIINYGRHNGKSAKTRALEQKKKARQRAENCPDVVPDLSRLEKRREDISTSLRSVDIELPTNEHRTIAKNLGLDCAVELAKYRDYLATHGKRHKSQVAGFRNWLRRAAEYKPKTDARAAVAATMFGESHDDQRDITAEVTRLG